MQSIVCINQDNTLEKNQQVRSMARIYALARKVRVWLGPVTNEELDALEPLFCSDTRIWSFDVLQEKYFHTVVARTRPTFAMLEAFISRGWFTRRWVLQEVAVGRVVVIHYGDRQVSWDHFHVSANSLRWTFINAAARFHPSYREWAAPVVRALENVVMLRAFREQTQTDLDTSSIVKSMAYVRILDLLQTYDTANCVDERDRLYSLYGMLPGTNRPEQQRTELLLACPIDYDIHFSKTYTIFALATIKAGLFHRVLEHVLEFGSLAEQNKSWPSWVPSWNKARRMSRVGTSLDILSSHWAPTLGRGFDDIWDFTEEKLWRADGLRLAWSKGSRTLYHDGCILHGRMHRIIGTQSDSNTFDPISFFQSHEINSTDPETTRHLMARTTALAIDLIPNVWSRSELDLRSVFNPRRTQSIPVRDSKLHYFFRSVLRNVLGRDIVRLPEPTPPNLELDGLLWPAVAELFGLNTNSGGPEWEFDAERFTSEAKQLLQDSDGFHYDCGGSKFGIALVQVKPGDFVFRTAAALRARAYNGDVLPSAVGLVIRPYHPQNSAGPATFRIVGMCVDYYLDVKDPETAEVVLV